MLLTHLVFQNLYVTNTIFQLFTIDYPVAEFKEFERRFKFKPRFKWLVPLKIVSNVSRDMPALNLNRGLADLNRGSNSLNSISGLIAYNFFNLN